MIKTIYIEKDIINHPRTVQIVSNYKKARMIICDTYQQIFNRKNQNYRIQKSCQSLILAKKHTKFVHQIKTNDTIGKKNNYYFSVSLNCPFDCQYCFLQGFYRSSNYVIFVNYEDFQKEIESITKENENCCFFSGYDTDSLAINQMTNFIDNFYPFFKKIPNHLFEIRTKSTAIAPLLEKESIDNCVIAYSLNPEEIINSLENKAPSLDNRLNAIRELQKSNWKIGLRFDPIIFHDEFDKTYQKFFQKVFSEIDKDKIHSITLGTARLPSVYYNNMRRTKTNSLFLSSLYKKKDSNCMTYERQEDIISFCKENILNYFDENKLFIHT